MGYRTRVVGALVLTIVVLATVLCRRNRGWPGLSLGPNGIAVAGLFTRLKPVIAWPTVGAITLQQRGAGPPVVTLAVNGRNRYVPRQLSFPPDQLHSLVENARLSTAGPSPQ